MNKIILIVIVLILFLFTVINFMGINEKFNTNTNDKDDSINSNIVVLNRILRTSNLRDIKQKYNSLTSFKL